MCRQSLIPLQRLLLSRLRLTRSPSRPHLTQSRRSLTTTMTTMMAMTMMTTMMTGSATRNGGRTMTKLVAGISKAAVEREAAMMEASSNFIWARKLRALRAALDKAEADRDRLAASVDAVMADRARIIGERDRLRLYAGHDDDCTINRYPATGACSCGLRAAHE